MAGITTRRIKTISEFHRVTGLPRPEHPLVSMVNVEDIKQPPELGRVNWVLEFFQVSVKRGVYGKIKYGQQDYDFDEGVMFFIAPNQIFRIEADPSGVLQPSGWTLLVHPDFLWNTSLATKIVEYEYFSYSVNEALFLSEKEESTLNNIVQNIRHEYHSNIDKFSKQIIISQLESLLNYAERFYHRQFITREKTAHHILTRLEKILNDWFNSDDLIVKGLPTVQIVASHLNVSPHYLSSMLKVLTAKTAQQHIHDKLIEKAKEKLSTTHLSISEIAYQLGFAHQQSFTKVFKSKTKLSPLEFRQLFN
jgi:AraC-like DNA-binding protein